MANPLQPTVLPPCLPSSLLTYVLEHYSPPTTLLICGTRAAFLSSLVQAVNATDDNNLSDTVKDEDSSEPEAEYNTAVQHPLLIPTLQQISTSRNMHTVFLPTVSHLRAYLAVHNPETPKGLGREFLKTGNGVPLLVVYGLVALHRDTSEWAAQGLGSSMASLVDAGFRANQRVVIIEERLKVLAEQNEVGSTTDVGMQVGDEEGICAREEHDRREHENSGWLEEQLPMLNGTTRRIGMESGDEWSGRTVDVGRVLGRWCRFLTNL